MAATNKRGVFSLETILERQSDYNWSDISNVFAYDTVTPAGPNTGYFAGGYSTSPSSTVLSQTQRIDFSNDTATAVLKGNLTINASSADKQSGTGSMSHGYIAGGNPASTNADRIDYANDTATATLKSSVLATSSTRLGAVANADYGYFGGGTPGPKSTVSRLDFSNDDGGGVAKGNLSLARYGLTGVGNQNFGYMTGGQGPRSTVDRIDYSSDTSTAAVKGPLASARYAHAATGNASYGYVAGGYPENVTGTTIQRIDYASDTSTSSPKGTLSESKYYLAGTGNQSYGYFGGGREQHDPGQSDFSSTSKIERIDFSNDTATASPKGPLAIAFREGAAVSARMNGLPNSPIGDQATGSPVSNHGYFTGGAYPSVSSEKSTIDRIDFTNDTATASPKGNTAIARKNHGATGSNSHGYSVGHFPANSTTDRIDYSNDTSTASPKGKLGEPKGYVSATGNNNFGYVAGGYSPGNGSPTDRSSTVDRLDYSNDSANCTQRANLSSGRSSGSMTGNQDFGYLCGGKVPGIVSTVERIDYSNDNATPLTKGPLSATRRYNHATGNANFGYVSGNGSVSTQIDRIDYSNDTSTASPKGPFSAAYSYRAATSTSSFGYFSGGQNPSSTVHTYIDRLDYSSDTTTASPKGNLSIACNKSAGVSSQECGLLNKPRRFRFYDNTPAPRGYFGGGWNNNFDGNPWYTYSMVERYNFDNDTAMAAPRGNLPNNGSYNMAGISTPAFSYFFGGSFYAGTFPFQYKSNAERLDHSNDLIINRRGTSNPIRYAAVTGNSNFAYISGSIYPAPYNPSPYTQLSSIVRFDFSNDNGTFNPTAAISSISTPTARAAVSSPAFGYYGGGYVSPASTTLVERIDFANDTSNLVAKGPLSQGRQSLGATGTSSYGYFVGGNTNPGGTYRTTIDRLDFSSDTSTAVAKGPLTVVKKEFGSVSSDSYGYFGGGYNLIPGGNNYISSTDRLDFSNDTATTVARGNLSRNRNQIAGTSAKVTATAPVQPPFSSPAPLPAPGPAYGYFAGGAGVPSPLYTTIDRVDFSNDTPTTTTKGALNTATFVGAATGNSSYGYYGGGASSRPGTPTFSTVDRIDYSSDTSTAATKGPLATAKSMLAATGNASYGYFGAGKVPSPTNEVSSVERIDYASDTSTAVEKGPLTSTRVTLAAVGNLNYAYFASGIIDWPTSTTNIDRIDYSSDTSTALVKGNLGSARRKFSGTGNASYGYVGGGADPNSDVHRIDYSNDTATASPKGPLTSARYNTAATGDASYGYWGGGYNTISTVDRVDYSNDTPTASPRGPLSLARDGASGVSARMNGLPN